MCVENVNIDSFNMKTTLILISILGIVFASFFIYKYIEKTTPHQTQLTELEQEMRIVEFDTNNPAAKSK